MPINPNTVILVVANPVDLLTTLAQDITRLPKERVIGVGTCLDTLRLQEEVSSFLGGTTEETVVCVVGVRDNKSQVVGWPTSRGGDGISNKERLDAEEDIQGRMKAIVAGEEGTPLEVGAVAASIAVAVLEDKRTVWTVSHRRGNNWCCYSWPVVVGREGVVREVEVKVREGEKWTFEKGVIKLGIMWEHYKVKEFHKVKEAEGP